MQTVLTQKQKVERICSNCDSSVTNTQTYKLKDGTLKVSPRWYTNPKGGYLCHKCRATLIDHIKWNKIHSSVYNTRRFLFRDKQFRANKNPRIGVCNWCRAVCPFDCKKTDLHHVTYHEEDPLKDTIEICNSCHKKFHLELRRGGNSG